MLQYLPLFYWLPIAGFLVSVLVPRKNENVLAGVAIATVGIQLAGTLLFTLIWLLSGASPLFLQHLFLYSGEHAEISICLYFDKTTAVFAVVGSILAFLVAVFSRYYIHREGGYKRFFCNILLFFVGYNVLVISGNYETMFVGWEMLGICTFLLVAFYRERYLPVKNSMKVISLYRLADICLILAMWMSHHLWPGYVNFLKLNTPHLVLAHLDEHYNEAVLASLLLVVAAAIKSAQFPFCSWLPRAMEGPTTSSAIFYGSLSVHVGVFILLRTHPYWDNIMEIKVLVIVSGIATSIIATGIAKLQSALKAQIAYASIAQIGLMFVEIALGLHALALIHFAGNAFLRTYQLLVSPSVQSYYVHELFFNFKAKPEVNVASPSSKLRNSLYLLSLKEWNMDVFQFRYLWSPFKWLGEQLVFLSSKFVAGVVVVVFLLGAFCFHAPAVLPATIMAALPYIFSLISFVLILVSFAERGNAISAWSYVVGGQLFMILAVLLHNPDFAYTGIAWYVGFSLLAALVGFVCLKKMLSMDNDIELNRFHGYIYEQPNVGLLFLICGLCVAGFPLTPTFIGTDLLFSHIQHESIGLIALACLSFLFMELSILRLYSRIFMGQHKKTNHAIAFKNS